MNGRWELTVTDPCEDGPVVTEHNSYDEMLTHIREVYDPTGRYADEGNGSMQTYLAGSGYEFDYRELPSTG